MTKFEKAVNLIAEEYREDCAEHECTIRELFKIYQYDSEDLKEEFYFILDEKFDGGFTEDLDIFEDDDTIKTFRQLAKAVRDFEF